MVYLGPLKSDLKKSSRVTQKSSTQTIFSILLKINILCVEFLKLFYNEIFNKFDWVLHLEISQSWSMSDFKMD